MGTLAVQPAARKPRAFHAQLHGLAGILTKPADAVLFLEPDSGAVVTITEADRAALVVLGSVEDAMAQYLEDLARGGYARICTTRAQEVA